MYVCMYVAKRIIHKMDDSCRGRLAPGAEAMHQYLHSRQERPIRQVGSELDADQVAISRSNTKTLLEILLEVINTVIYIYIIEY